jgi:hypothetical protein
MREVIEKLLASDDPSVCFKTRVNVLGESPRSAGIEELREEIRSSARVRALLADRDAGGRIPYPPYAKWYGAHWILAALADIGYPPGDRSLMPLCDQVCACWRSPRHLGCVRTVQGRTRRCASQEANALYALLTLELADERADDLARNLLRWQWPDGGWNCDKKPGAENSSFHETLIPLRALALYAERRDCDEARKVAREAAEVFLKRRLFLRQHDGSVIDPRFCLLHYPPYWHYDILCGLKVMAEAGVIDDPRCRDALDLLESKRLDDGGFPAERKYYRATSARTKSGGWVSGRSPVDWGGASVRRMNEFVTADALYVLTAAGRDEVTSA